MNNEQAVESVTALREMSQDATQAPAVLFSYTPEKLADLAAKSVELTSAATPDEYKAIVKAIAPLRAVRVAIEKERKDKKAAILESGRTLDSKANALQLLISPEETRLRDLKVAEDDRAAAVEAARLEALRERVFAIGHMNADELAALEIGDEFGELQYDAEQTKQAREAELARDATVEAERQRMADQQAELDAEAARLAAMQAEQDRKAAAQDAEAQAERDKIAAEAQAARDKIAAERAESERVDRERKAAEQAVIDEAHAKAQAQIDSDRKAAANALAELESEKREACEKIAAQQAEIDATNLRAKLEKEATAKAEKDAADKVQREADMEAERVRLMPERESIAEWTLFMYKAIASAPDIDDVILREELNICGVICTDAVDKLRKAVNA